MLTHIHTFILTCVNTHIYTHTFILVCVYYVYADAFLSCRNLPRHCLTLSSATLTRWWRCSSSTAPRRSKGPLDAQVTVKHLTPKSKKEEKEKEKEEEEEAGRVGYIRDASLRHLAQFYPFRHVALNP